MSQSQDTATPAVAARTKVRPGLTFFIVVVSATLLFAAEIWAMTLGFLWAFIGIMSLSSVSAIVLSALVLPLAAFATWRLAVLAVRGELDLLPVSSDRQVRGSTTRTG
ncbi:hypothetical protein [Stappia sp. 28M-7]|jgi:hypothetical protein|uniref:hypothetical protein n=1 Tax=Stappia sp. 28M-7 TaxID=2762596 RepID=UPI000E70B42D|nr:hypothetical protein [Stappia sp. 28M-7]MBC2860402.1 hypothetical protein [Stappia sp. 28M-7]